MPVSKPLPVAEWPCLPVLVQVTVSPAFTVIVPGLKLKSTIETEPGPAATATGEEGSVVVSGAGAASCAGAVVVVAGAFCVVAGRAPPPPPRPRPPAAPRAGDDAAVPPAR